MSLRLPLPLGRKASVSLPLPAIDPCRSWRAPVGGSVRRLTRLSHEDEKKKKPWWLIIMLRNDSDPRPHWPGGVGSDLSCLPEIHRGGEAGRGSDRRTATNPQPRALTAVHKSLVGYMPRGARSLPRRSGSVLEPTGVGSECACWKFLRAVYGAPLRGSFGSILSW